MIHHQPPEPLICRGAHLSPEIQVGFYGTPLQVLQQQGHRVDEHFSTPWRDPVEREQAERDRLVRKD